ncbi:conserved hypothetical protein; putative signal peptide [Acinetobacter baylyi ADP1]|uniref:Lipoprotein n=2 Tax=Moraxellaceae TaxID=468 RepID=Q6FE43_ACIAD|nr:conserved hypothetical protein; putative signal peptide [Acinetobacter baylyi ADP1]
MRKTTKNNGGCMKKISIMIILLSSFTALTACNWKDTVRPPKAERAMSIAGMPVYEKDYRLNNQMLAKQQPIQPD